MLDSNSPRKSKHDFIFLSYLYICIDGHVFIILYNIDILESREFFRDSCIELFFFKKMKIALSIEFESDKNIVAVSILGLYWTRKRTQNFHMGFERPTY